MLAVAPGVADAKAPRAVAGYEGAWTVMIITEAGSCDQAYSFPVEIRRQPGDVQQLLKTKTAREQSGGPSNFQTQ
jgi:hypothetical protein